MSASFLLDDPIFDDSVYSTNHSNLTDDLNNFNHHDHPIYGSNQLTLSQALAGPSTSAGTPVKQYPTFDPDSPFNSSIGAVRVPGKDGRLKTRLSGVGAEGGYLVSPMVVNKARMGGGMAGTPEIAIASPAPSHHNPTDGYAGDDLHGLGEMGSGMGIGIDGLDLDGYGNPNVRMYGIPKQPTHLNNVDTLPNSPQDLIGFRIASPPPTQSTSATTLDVQRRPKKNLSVRTINKAKSCSALSPSKARAASKPNHPHEPLTPVSIEHSPSGFHQPGVPYNSPVDAILAEQGMNLPFNFESLYNIGLAHDSIEQIDPRKSPYAFTNDLLNAENGTLGLGVSTPGNDDFAGLHMLPTPSLQHSSNFPSPGTPYQQSPEMLGLGYTNGIGGQPMMNAPSMHSIPSMSSAGSGMSASSIDEMYRQNTNGFVQPQRRTVSYNPAAHHHMISPEMMLSPPMMQQQISNNSRQPSNQSAYGGPNAKYAYPSRLGHGHPAQHQHQQQQQQYPAPPMSWTNSNTSDYSQMGSSVFVPGFDPRSRDYQRSLNEFESDIYARYSQQSTAYGNPSGKRSRRPDDGEYDDYDEEDEIERAGDEFDYVTGPGQTFSPNGQTLRHSASQKRLRTVASAPNLIPPGLPTNLPALPTRRMRPGPKPKSLQSPQEQHQSVFSAILSPPQLQQGFRRSVSPFPQGDGSGGGSDDEGDALGGLPKGYIQSLYRGIPSHTDATGTKQAKRYICLMESCDRTFPRKSAIESHIQTHLEDKPFICPHSDCDASFVRQHDLRRHERIHSGNKPFPCPCGKGFARGDALARHRARGICSGSLVPRRI